MHWMNVKTQFDVRFMLESPILVYSDLICSEHAMFMPSYQ